MRHALTLILILILSLALLLPIGVAVREGFIEDGAWSLAWLRDVLDSPILRRGLLNSFYLAAATTLGCLLISLPLAVIADRFNFVCKRVWLGLILIPMILPPFVGAIGLKGMLSRNGGINALLSSWGWIDPTQPIDFQRYPFWMCVAVEVLGMYPIMFLNIQAALANVDPAMLEAASNLGASPWRRFWRVTLPLIRPGIFAGGTLVFIWTFNEIGAPLMVGFPNVAAVQLFNMLMTTAPAGDAYALVVLMLVISLVTYGIGKLLLGRSAGAMMAKAITSSGPQRLGPLGSTVANLTFALVFAAAALPHVGVLLYSLSSTGMLEFSPQYWTLEHYRGLLNSGASTQSAGGLAALSMLNSLRYSVLATVIDVLLGFWIAYLVVRRRSWLTGVLDHLAMLPLAVPGLVLAFGYFAVTQGDSPLSALNPLRHDPTPLLVIAYAVRRLPFLTRACAAGLEQTSEALEEAAASLGAGKLRTIALVVLPLLMANLLAGGLMVFSRSMLEVSDSLLLTFDEQSYPVTKAIWALAAIPQTGTETAAALGVCAMVFLLALLAVTSLLLGRRLGALFR
jgi:iron(III) transport system permease protein